jgi:hypothetical protein
MEFSAPGDRELLSFFLCEPGKYVTRITAQPCDTCAMLAALFPDRRMLFIFKGMVLTPATTFESSGIRTNDTVVGLVNRGATLGEVREWVQSTKDMDAFDEVIRSIMNIPTGSELMRLRDIALLKAELRPRQIRRSIKKYMENRPRTEASDANAKSVIGEAPTELSTAMLPPLW